jgi:hypothetical protein
MKSKDLAMLLIAVVIFLVAGYLGYTQFLAPKNTDGGAKTVEVEVVGVIAPDFDQDTLAQLADTSTVRNFSVPLDLTTGLGNQAVFGR